MSVVLTAKGHQQGFVEVKFMMLNELMHSDFTVKTI